MKVLFDPAPRTFGEIFSSERGVQFLATHNVIHIDDENRNTLYDAHLPDCDIVISQQPMDRARIDVAKTLKAIFNVETNFLPNIDYERCFERGIHVLAPSGVFAQAVAEMGLGMALDLARGISRGHSEFVNGAEQYGLAGNRTARLMQDSTIGIIGFGDIGRALKTLLAGFRTKIIVHDPWLPDDYLRRLGVEPTSKDDLLSRAATVFVTAAITTENQNFLDGNALALLPDNSGLILLSRAAAVDFDAMIAEARSGRLSFATDVFPKEPVAPDDPLRRVPNITFSAHRAGALTDVLHLIGDYVLEDINQIARGLPPVACKRAEREIVGKLRSVPISKS